MWKSKNHTTKKKLINLLFRYADLVSINAHERSGTSVATGNKHRH